MLQEMDTTNVVFRTKHTPFEVNEMHEILNAANRGEYNELIVKGIPFKPKAGDVLLYRKKSESDIDYRADQYTWRNCGPKYLKGKSIKLTRYFAWTETSYALNYHFKRYVYELADPLCKDSAVIAIHYVGDESIFEGVQKPHGNCKNIKKPYVRTAMSTIDLLKELMKHDAIKPKEIYHDVAKKCYSNVNNDALFKRTEPALAPRDTKQVRNAREAVSTSRMVTRDELFSLHELNSGDLEHFVRRIYHKDEDRDGGQIAIVLGATACLELAKSVLRESCKYPRQYKQLISYDTTFQCGDTYVSVLVMRNIFLQGDPIFPALFLLHDKKKQWHHKVLFAAAEEYFKRYLKSLPFATDRELAIVNAAKKVLDLSDIGYCNNHIIRDVESWIKNQGNYKKDDVIVLKHHVQLLLNSETEKEFNIILSEVSVKWSKEFLDYFNNRLREDITQHSAKFITSKYLCSKDCSATNNDSESFNKN